MMNRKCMFTFIVLFVLRHSLLLGQADEVLLRIDGTPVFRTEFDFFLARTSEAQIIDKKKKTSLLSEFIDAELCLHEAKAMGLDTLLALRYSLETYHKKHLIESVPLSNTEEQWKLDYVTEQTQKDKSSVVCFAQIFRPLSQNGSSAEEADAIELLNKVYTHLTTDPNADFQDYVARYSQDKSIVWVKPNECLEEMEQILYSLPVGAYSTPFLTPQGAHLVKILGRKKTSLSEVDADFQERKARRYSSPHAVAALQELKQTFNYIPNEKAISALIATGDTGQELFTIEGKSYFANDFQRFSQGNPKGIERVFNDFLLKSLIDQEFQALIEKKQALPFSTYEHNGDSLLLAEVVRMQIEEKAHTDKAGLTAFFMVNKKRYKWKPFRYVGTVIHAHNKKELSKAKKVMKKKMKEIPFSEWEKVAESNLPNVKVEVALFKQGDNAYVDKAIYKKGKPELLTSYPYYAVIGEKVKYPTHYSEVMDELAVDYRQFLEENWLAELRGKYKVEIDKEVLKTVNNH